MIKGNRQKFTARAGESCLSSWLSIQSFVPSICQARPQRLHWGLNLSATLSLACNCSVIQAPVSHFISPFCPPLRRLEARDTETGSALLQPAHSVYMQQINTNMAGEYEILPGAWTKQQLPLTSHINWKKKDSIPRWLLKALALSSCAFQTDWICRATRRTLTTNSAFNVTMWYINKKTLKIFQIKCQTGKYEIQQLCCTDICNDLTNYISVPQ